MLGLLRNRLIRLIPSNEIVILLSLMFVLFPKAGLPQYPNNDVIVNRSNDSIICTIEKIDATSVVYHIKRVGVDPKTKILLTQVVTYKYQNRWYYANGMNTAVDKAREYILSGKIHEAIAVYAQMISKDSLNAVLLAEGAYALALGGVYDAALMRLDRSWSIGANAPEVNYFIAQVFLLMGYGDLATEYWITSSKYYPPEWITVKSQVLVKKYGRDPAKKGTLTREELIATFKTANLLAANNQYFQSIALFHKIIDVYPNNYLPYVGYSIVLEKTGALGKSAEVMERAASLVGNKPEDLENKKILEQRIAAIRQMKASSTYYDMPGLSQKKGAAAERPVMMVYAGGMVGESMVSINSRFGYFTSTSSNASVDFGVSSNAGITSVNLGISGYVRLRSLVSGVGFLMVTGNSSTTFMTKISVGISKMNKNRTSSFDLFLDLNAGLSKGSVTTLGLSIGKTIYFGKRK